MTAFGLWVLGSTIWYLMQGGVPGAMVMGLIWHIGARGECNQRGTHVRVPDRRQQYALGLAVQPQRRHRQCRGNLGGGRGLLVWQSVARCQRRLHHGRIGGMSIRHQRNRSPILVILGGVVNSA